MKKFSVQTFLICTLVIVGIILIFFLQNNKKVMSDVDVNKTDPNIEIINIKSERYMFFPTMIRLQKGKTYKLTLSTLDVQHGIFQPDLKLNLSAFPGKADENIITPEKVGEYTTGCSLYCGVDHNKMKLTFIVYE